MKKYDFIVIGSGAGMLVVDEAMAHGLKVALVDRGPLGGTCLNVGCIPSKLLIFPADRIAEIQESVKLGIEAEIKHIDFNSIMERMRKSIAEYRNHMRQGVSQLKKLDFYEGEGYFVGDYTMEVNGERIRGERIFVASGSRPLIPPIKGIDGIDYLTNETALQLTARPDSIIIIGGGYIAVEFGHFFAAMGTEVTILEMGDCLVQAEEPEISELLMNKMSQRMRIYINAQAEEVKRNEKGCTVVVKDKDTGKKKEFTAEKILVAVGRKSNADLLKVENTGVETDEKGFIKVDEYLETSKEHIFAVGDANGQQMFRHTANREASLAIDNVMHGGDTKMDYSASPHAVYSHPQIASVGLTEAAARKKHDILVGIARYSDVTKGKAMMEKDGFVKAIVEKDSGKILGCHIIGPYAPILIQEVVNVMAAKGNIDSINLGIHIHPALPELIQVAFNSLEQPR